MKLSYAVTDNTFRADKACSVHQMVLGVKTLIATLLIDSCIIYSFFRKASDGNSCQYMITMNIPTKCML